MLQASLVLATKRGDSQVERISRPSSRARPRRSPIAPLPRARSGCTEVQSAWSPFWPNSASSRSTSGHPESVCT